MENKQKRFFFVIGMPRTRTAWMSVLLSQGDSICAHEGTAGFAEFEDYAKWMHDRATTYAAVGDSNSTLVFHVEELLEWFPGAVFVFVHRDEDAALASLIATAPGEEAVIRGWWPVYMTAWNDARERLAGGRSISWAVLCQNPMRCCGLYHDLTGLNADWTKVAMLKDLRITTMAAGPYVQPPAPAVPVQFKAEGRLTLARLRELGFNLDGITVRQYTQSDYDLVSGWWKSHLGRELSPAEIPGLGVVVENGERPVAALFCCEVYGSLSARLEFPVTAPGMKLADAQRFLAVAVVACMQLAGRRIVPEPPQFQLFHVATPPAIARTLKRLGFVEDPRDKVNLCFNNHQEESP